MVPEGGLLVSHIDAEATLKSCGALDKQKIDTASDHHHLTSLLTSL